jgi:hypothetical protein
LHHQCEKHRGAGVADLFRQRETCNHKEFSVRWDDRRLQVHQFLREATMRIFCYILMLVTAGVMTGSALAQVRLTRPPAIPLITTDPYFSVWSFTDQPGEDYTRHWTGRTMSVCSMARVDGKPFRLVGKNVPDLPLLPLVATEITPTQTRYTFKGEGVVVTMTFTVPLLPDSLPLISAAVGYITWEVSSADGKPHCVEVYVDHSAELCLDTPNEKVAWGRAQIDGLDVLRMGSAAQPVLERKGDDVRIDWGHSYFVSPSMQHAASVIGAAGTVREAFVGTGTLPGTDDLDSPRPGNQNWPVTAFVLPFQSTHASPQHAFVMLAYDDGYAIEFFHRTLPAYWKYDGTTVGEFLVRMAKAYPRVLPACDAFDRRLTAELARAGGANYASVGVLLYRQVFAAHKLVADIDGTPMLFPKENFSNGCISTVDVIYPSAPFFLALNPRLLEALLTPVFEYAAMPRWKFPFAPHDLGTYPKANGQVYGGGERDVRDQMPVEESGNMIILTYALCRREGSAAYARKYWNSLKQWAEYLKEKGLDPENQLCTDDFTGHLAHNTNLSVKAIAALGCYARLCGMTGQEAEQREYAAMARRYAVQWESMARDGDHYRLAFDRPGTWSMKYNLVWDTLLDLNLFPPEVRTRELAYYRTKMQTFGLPLDNRADFTKPEWMIWTATMSTDSTGFASYIDAITAYLNTTPDRVPFSDWYETKTARRDGFQARSVVGGMYIRLLAEKRRGESR